METGKIIFKAPSELIPYKNNPRKNEDAIDKVATSISEFGFKQPIVVDKNNIIIVGHTRWKAALKLGLKEVPVIIADDLTPAQAKAYRIADNKTNEYSTWDYENLETELDELKDFDINLDWLGLSEKDNDYSDEFILPNGDREPFQQMTFTLADEQAEEIKSALKIANKDNKAEIFGNQNSNGNAIYRIVSEWLELKK